VDKKILGFLLVVIVASGCTDPNSNGDTGGDGPELASDRGLQIEAFRSTDETLRPSQPAVVNLRLKNYHTEDFEIDEISIYNEGDLTVEDKTCTPEIGDLGLASENNYPEMECQWDLEAPPESYYGNFDSKPASMNLHLEYSSSLTNEDPFKVRFKPLDEINTSSSISKTFRNSEVSMSVESENPVPIESGRTIEVSASEIGQGRLVADSSYEFDFRPSSIFGDDCYREESAVVGNEVEFSCSIGQDGEVQEGTRNLVFSTSYKYVKEPVLNVKLVNEQ
jgi:hypothetical protein